MNLRDTLPDLELAMESALLPIGRGDIVDQLREVGIERWERDEFADITSIFVAPGEHAPPARTAARAETVSLYDEIGVMLETDARGRVTVIEVSGGNDLVARLEAARAASGP